MISGTGALRKDANILALEKEVSDALGLKVEVHYDGNKAGRVVIHYMALEQFDDIIRRLVEMQYTRNDLDFSRGTYRVRGEVIDIFPAENFDLAIRINLFDDTIESLYYFDPLTGKLKNQISGFTVFPSSHYVTPKDTVDRALEAIKQELSSRIKEFEASGNIVAAHRIKERTKFDLEMLEQTGFCKGIENYSRHITNRQAGEPPPTLIDYLPQDSIMFIDESHATIPQIGGMFNGDQARKKNLIDYGFRLPSALDNRPLAFNEFETKMPQTIFVSATPGEYELTHMDNLVEQVVRPTGLIDPIIEIRDVNSQIDNLLDEIRLRVKQNARVLVTTLTKKMAEKLSEYYTEQNVKIKYLHSDIDTVERVEIIRDLRLGVFDVLVGVNLLREGLDMPEVSLVAILDADKEGFLRSYKSLIQTVGRAARHIDGMAIFYAAKVTKAMQITIDETNRRRDKQIAYNKLHNITPMTIVKPIVDIIDGVQKNDKQDASSSKVDKSQLMPLSSEHLTEKDVLKLIKQLTKQLNQHVKNLEFEDAIKCRDQIAKLNKLIYFS